MINGRAVPMPDSDTTYGSVRRVDTNKDGRALVQIERAFIDEEGFIRVEQIVELYEPNEATPAERVRTNLEDRYIPVANPLALTFDGEVRVLRTDHDSVEIAPLSGTGERLGEFDDLQLIAGYVNHAYPRSWHPICEDLTQSMTSVSGGYIWLQRSYSQANLTGACSGRIRPSNLVAKPAWTGMVYKWGGFDTVASYNSRANSGTPIGDVNNNISTGRTCAAGVDCSGYVTRVWGETSHANSQYLGPTYGYLVRPSVSGSAGLRRHDSIATPGHIQMYFSAGPNASQVYMNESTTVGYNRTVVRVRNWSDFNGRQAYRSRLFQLMGCS